MTSYHEYNKIDKAYVLISKMQEGQNIALITDAGTPGISDPGEELAAMCYEAGIEVTSLPGPAACITALTLSGLPTRRFAFEAFLPADKKERKLILEELKNETRTIILYEAPHRLVRTLEELKETLGNRRMTLCRELTKRYETAFHTTIEELILYYQTEKPLGECVLVIEGRSRQEMEEELKNIENTVTNSNDVNIAENAINNNEKKETSKKYIDEEFNESDDINEDENLNRKEETIEIVSDGSVMHIKGKNGIYDAFYRKDNDKYTILRGSRIRYSESYTPKKVWEQNKKNITADGYLLCDIGDLVISAAAKLIEGMSTNGKELDAPERIMGENETYSVTFDSSKTMEETDGKMINPKEKSEFCGEDSSVFKLMGYEQKKDNAKMQGIVEQNAGFEYTLWGDFHTSGKMVDMLNDIFDLIAEKHPEKIKDIAENDKITAVARKTDLDEKTANISKIKQFSNYKGKEHSVEGEVYCVNAGYNRDGCIKQIERMLIVCGGNSNDFKITKAPHKSTHSASKSGKKDIDEILNV